MTLRNRITAAVSDSRIATFIGRFFVGLFRARVDLWAFIAILYVLVVGLFLVVLTQHGEIPPSEAESLGRALAYILYFIIAIPILGGLGTAIAWRWADKLPYGGYLVHGSYISRSERADLVREAKEAAREEVRRELGEVVG